MNYMTNKIVAIQGDIPSKLNPETDTWINTRRLEARVLIEEGNFAETLERLQETQGFDQNGFGPNVWGSWNTWWTGQRFNRWTNDRRSRHQQGRGWAQTSDQRRRDNIERGRMTRQGTRQVVV